MTGAFILATGNRHKLAEMEELLPAVELQPLPAGFEMPPEDGDSFAANALIKARAAHAATGEVTIADDSGIAAEDLGGAPGIYSARYAGEGASDEVNLDKLLREVDAAGGNRRAAYVCAIALIDETGVEHVFEARCEGRLLGERARQRRLRLRPGLRPRRHRPRRRAHLRRAERRREERDQPPRPGRAQARRPPRPGGGRHAVIRTKSRAAALSIASNAVLIALKLAAGAITGSIAIITEAVHSLIDLVASVVAFFSVRKADEPADAEHPYGHEKVENLAAAIEGMLILVGAGVIVYEATHQLVQGAEVDRLGVGIAVMAFSVFANLGVSTVLSRQAKAHESQALEGDAAHLRTDAMTSAGVLFGLALVQITGDAAFDPITALVVAVAIVWAGFRILRRSSGGPRRRSAAEAEMDRIEEAIASARTAEVAGYHKLRARRAGSRRHIDLHVQYRSGTSLERAHELAHQMRDSIEAEIPRPRC